MIQKKYLKVKEMKTVQLPTTSYDCMLQQFTAVCNHLHGDFHNLLIGERLCGENGLSFKENYFENSRKYYGLELVKASLEDTINGIEKGNAYLTLIKIDKYPFCANLLEEDVAFHCLIAYELEGNFVRVFDNFYDEPAYLFSKHDFEMSFIKSWKIGICNERQESYEAVKEDIQDLSKALCLFELDHKFQTSDLETLNYRNTSEDIIFQIFGFMNRKADLYVNATDNVQIKICAESIRNISEAMRSLCYSLVKRKIKKGKLFEDDMMEFKDEINKLCSSFIKIVNELNTLSSGEIGGVWATLEKQFDKYSKGKFNLDDSVYLVHDGLTIMKWILFLEEENECSDINPLIFSGKDTYAEFLQVIYRLILGEVRLN